MLFVEHAHDLAKIIAEESNALSEDPYLVTSMSFHESSFKPGDKAVGKIGERGLMQVHGEALMRCTEYVKGRGIRPETPRAEIACGVYTLSQSRAACGYLVADEARCAATLEGCGGALARYLAGDCSAQPKGARARGVRVRLKLRNELASQGNPTILAVR